MTAPLRFLLDEHVWGGLLKLNQELNIDIVLVQTQLPEGTDDESVLQFAAKQGRVLLTSNAQDFAPLAASWFLANKEHAGIIIVPGQTDRSLLVRAIRNLCQQQHSAASLRNTYRFLQEFV